MKLDLEIYDRLIRYCSYQERAESEVRKKMMQLEVPAVMGDDYLHLLKEDDFQNEERYALSFIEGKFRMKGWGKLKIQNHLRAKGVEQDIILRNMENLSSDSYLEQLRELAESKLEKVKGKNDYERKGKVFRYLQQRGYESSLIHRVLFDK